MSFVSFAQVSALLLMAGVSACRPLAPVPDIAPARTAPGAAGVRTADVAAVPLHDRILGTHSWRVTTSSPVAQAYFDQGLRLMYAYAKEDARKSFAAARDADPKCAMCWWGDAWSAGSYLNGPMRPADAPAAHAAVTRAQALAGGATPVERAVIGALASRYAAVHPPGGRSGLDSAYADAMADVHASFPAHDEVTTLYADALMLLEPRRGVWPMTKPSIPQIHGLLEQVLARNLGHPGACHAYIHATETTPNVGRAQACADLLSAAIPAVSHINHMPSHTYNRVGRWGDATRANLEAVATDRRAPASGYAIYPAHNLHMLMFSAAVDGQENVSVQAANGLAAILGDDGSSFQALALVRFGRFADLLKLTTKPAHPVHEGLWAFGLGLAHLRLGGAAGTDSARAWLARVDSLAKHAPPTAMARQHTAARLLGIVGGILRGELLMAAGQHDDAFASYRAAIALEEGLAYDEPEPLTFKAHEYFGAALLEAGRAAEAIPVYEAALVARPNSGWSLFGLEAALRASGKGAEADAVRERLAQAWQRSGVTLRSSRY